MSRLNLNVPDDLHEAFRVALAQMEEGDTQTKFLRKCMRACAEGRLWFENQYPRTRTEGDTRFAPAPVATPPTVSTAVKKLPDPVGGPDITAKDYAHWVSTWRMNGYNTMDTADLDDMVKWGVEEYKCNEYSLRDLIKAYPPDFGHVLQKKTDRFIGLEG